MALGQTIQSTGSTSSGGTPVTATKPAGASAASILHCRVIHPVGKTVGWPAGFQTFGTPLNTLDGAWTIYHAWALGDVASTAFTTDSVAIAAFEITLTNGTGISLTSPIRDHALVAGGDGASGSANALPAPSVTAQAGDDILAEFDNQQNAYAVTTAPAGFTVEQIADNANAFVAKMNDAVAGATGAVTPVVAAGNGQYEYRTAAAIVFAKASGGGGGGGITTSVFSLANHSGGIGHQLPTGWTAITPGETSVNALGSGGIRSTDAVPPSITGGISPVTSGNTVTAKITGYDNRGLQWRMRLFDGADNLLGTPASYVNIPATEQLASLAMTVPTGAAAEKAIVDFQAAPVGGGGGGGVTVSSVASTAGVEGATLTHTVTLSAATTAATQFAFSLVGGTATAGADYNATPTFGNGVTLSGGNVTVPIGVTSFPVSIELLTDATSEGAEAYTLTIGGVVATGTIVSQLPGTGETSLPGGTGTGVVSGVSTASAAENQIVYHNVMLTAATTAQISVPIVIAAPTPANFTTMPIPSVPDTSLGISIAGGNMTIPAGVRSFQIATVSDKAPGAAVVEPYTLTLGGVTGHGYVFDDARAYTPAATTDTPNPPTGIYNPQLGGSTTPGMVSQSPVTIVPNIEYARMAAGGTLSGGRITYWPGGTLYAETTVRVFRTERNPSWSNTNTGATGDEGGFVSYVDTTVGPGTYAHDDPIFGLASLPFSAWGGTFLHNVKYIAPLPAQVATPPATATRPVYNTGTSFYVAQNSPYIYGPTNKYFRGLGDNITHFDNNDGGARSIVASGANICRTFAWFDENPEWWGATRDKAAVRAILATMVNILQTNSVVWMPVIADTGTRAATIAKCGTSPTVRKITGGQHPLALECAVDVWIDAKGWLDARADQNYIINVANEYGMSREVWTHAMNNYGQGADPEVWALMQAGTHLITSWRDNNIIAIQRLRTAGFKQLIVIDMPDYAQNYLTAIADGQAVFDADPQKNVALSYHCYGETGWSGALTPRLQALRAALPNVPIILGEFGPGRGVGNQSESHYPALEGMQVADRSNMWRLIWSMDDGSPVTAGTPGAECFFRMVYDTAADYTGNPNQLTVVGKQSIDTPVFGLKAMAVKYNAP